MSEVPISPNGENNSPELENSYSEENSETSPQTPKRHGRKRKQEIIARDTDSTSPETTSRRGRKRKQINYFELANPERLDEYSEEYQQQALSFQAFEEKKRQKVKQETVNVSTESPEEHHNEQENDGTNGSSDIADSVPSTSTSKSKSGKYSYTGKTVKMINTLFTLYSHKVEPRCDISNTSNNDSAHVETHDQGDSVKNTSPAPKKRQYKKKKVNAKEEVEEEADGGPGIVTCAVCDVVVEKTLWTHHKQRFHNNLAWRVGDPPLDLSDQSFVMYTLNMLYKKKKPLYCQCGEVKKSVVGFLSHQATCQLTAEQVEEVKVGCEVCGKRMLPVSMMTHMKFVHSNHKNKQYVRVGNENNKNLVTATKRGAAKKALQLIKNVTSSDESEETNFTSDLDFNQDFVRDILINELTETQAISCKYKCEFVSHDLEEVIKHHDVCSQKFSMGFLCKVCVMVFEKLEDVIFHVESAHKVNIEVNDDNDSREFCATDKGGLGYPTFLYTTVKKTQRVLYPNAFNWTYKFQEKNFFNKSLFQNFFFNQSDWRLVPVDYVEPYLPKMEKSCDVSWTFIRNFADVLYENHELRKFDLYESEIQQDGKITIFCGGPVASMSWLPTPYDEENANQVLAVSVLDSPDDKYLTSEIFNLPGAIQFWNFGAISNRESYCQRPMLAFNLAHDHGPVWHMEWCPSGCFNFMDEIRSRMGLLAVTGGDSVVYIYSIPFFQPSDMGLYFKPKAVIKLLLQRAGSPLLGGQSYYPSKLSWSKAVGHEFICVGYTNGFVAIFNLKSTTQLLNYKDIEGIACVLPQKCFQAHSHSITACEIFHLSGGGRWLMTSSLDRGLSLWDLNNYNYPLYTVKKNIITDGFWWTNWLAQVVSADEGSTTANVVTTLKNAADFTTETVLTMSVSSSTVTSISGSDWLNAIIQVNMAGEITAIFPHQVHYFNELYKILKKRRMLFGYTTLVDKRKSPEERMFYEEKKRIVLKNLSSKKSGAGIKFTGAPKDHESSIICCDEPLVYRDAEERYGLLFCDNKMDSYDDFPESTALQELSATSNSFSISQPNQYPMSAINKVVFNPNRQASLYYATGYQVGFVRVSCMKFLANDSQIK